LNQCTCVHCNKQFTGNSAIQQLRNHFGHCKKRVLLRHLKYQSYVFVICLNPKEKLRKALNEIVNEQESIDIPALVVGGLRTVLALKQISAYHPIEIKHSPDFLSLPNGVTSYRKIVVSLSAEDLELFGSECQKIYENRFKNEV